MWRVRRNQRLELVDLTQTTDLTFALLDDTRAWRQRLVEEFVLGSSWHAEVVSSYQIEIPRAVIEPFLDGVSSERVRAYVPLTTKPKRPLLRFDLVSPRGGSATLLPRHSIAAIQAEYLYRLALVSPASDDIRAGIPLSLIEAICLFTPGVTERFSRTGHLSDQQVAQYLRDGLRWAPELQDVRQWRGFEAGAASRLIGALGEPADPLSSSEHVLLALPFLQPLPESPHDVTQLLLHYAEATLAAHEAGDRNFLQVLGEYGRRWEVIVEATLPLQEPAILKMAERRPLELTWYRPGKTRQLVNVGDAQSVHVQVHVDDHAVVLGGFEVRDLSGSVVGIPFWEGVRDTPESLALYTADPDRPYYVELTLHLRPTFLVRTTLTLIELLAWAAFGTVMVYRQPPDPGQLTGVLELLTVPTTFAVALLLTRQQTSLSARLQASQRARIILATALLWALALTRLLTYT